MCKSAPFRENEPLEGKGEMTLYHFTMKTISRRKKKSVIAAAAYRSGERLHDTCSNRCYDFTWKRGVAYRKILLPSNAPPEFRNREILWNTVEQTEHRKDSRLAREAEFALPREFTLEEQVDLARTFVQDNFVSLGMCADLCIHHRDEKNPHAHVLLTDRPVDCNGFLSKKDRSWNQKEQILLWRESWARTLNEAYRQKGLEKRVTHESYKTRGITNRKPTKHLGYRVLEYARQGQVTDRLLEHLESLQSDAERERILALLGRDREQMRKREYQRGRSR